MCGVSADRRRSCAKGGQAKQMTGAKAVAAVRAAAAAAWLFAARCVPSKVTWRETNGEILRCAAATVHHSLKENARDYAGTKLDRIVLRCMPRAAAPVQPSESVDNNTPKLKLLGQTNFSDASASIVDVFL